MKKLLLKLGKLSKKQIFVIVIIACVLVFGLAQCSGCGSEPLNWPNSGISTVLPEPESKKGHISVDSENSFSATIPGSEEDFRKYVQACKDKGFSIDPEEDTGDYKAYNSDGYKVDLYYYQSSKEYIISLDAPKVNEELDWPTTALVQLIPKPDSEKGSIVNDSSTGFTAYVGDISESDYVAYVKSCMKKGFTEDYSKGDTYFNAKDKAGNSLRLEYQGFNTMYIDLDKTSDESNADSSAAATSTDEEKEDTSTKSSSDDSKSSKKTTSKVSSDFKKTMDSYEDFFDEYCEFMEKYSKAKNPSASMMADYADYLEKYTDVMEKLEVIDEDELSAADAAYYAEVNARIAKKLSDLDV